MDGCSALQSRHRGDSTKQLGTLGLAVPGLTQAGLSSHCWVLIKTHYLVG